MKHSNNYSITPMDWDLLGDYEPEDKRNKRTNYVYGTQYDARLTEKQEQAIFNNMSNEVKYLINAKWGPHEKDQC
jgi:hypothetical protein